MIIISNASVNIFFSIKIIGFFINKTKQTIDKYLNT